MLSIWPRRLALFAVILGFIASSLALGALPAHATSCPTAPSPLSTPASAIIDSGVYTVCDFRGWSFAGLTRTGVDFQISHLGGANFSGATFTNAQHR